SNISIVSNSGTGANANYSSYTESYSVIKGFQTFNIELAQTKGNVSGVVYEDLNKNGAFDNEPLVSGAVVSVIQSGATTSTPTDALGNFILTGLSFGSLNITATKTNYKDSAKTVTLPANANLSNVYIGLYKPTGKLTGRIVDLNTPDPKQGIAGVSVKILGFSNLTTTTDSTGGYMFNEVLANNGGVSQYTIVGDGSALGYGVTTKQCEAPAESAIINAPDIELSKASRLVYGKITDSVTNAGISGIKVKIQGTAYEADTDNSGVYVFNAIPVNTASNYTLGISDTVTVNGAPRYQNRDDVSISVNNETTPLKIQNIPLTPNVGKIRGTVYDSITGFPIKSSLFTEPIQAEITISGLAAPVTATVSQVNGEFTMENIPGGSYNLKIKHAVTGTNLKMFEEVSRNALVTAGQTIDLGIIYVTLKTMTIKGRVKDKIVGDKVSSIPGLSDYYISGALVQASINGIPYTKTATTSYDGSYQLTVPVYSNYTFKASATNYIDSEQASTEVVLSNTLLYHTQNFSIDPRVGNISSTVFLDSNNNGYYDVGDTVKIKDAHPKYMNGDFKVKTNYRGVPFSVSVENNSAFTITNLPVGSYYLTVDPPAANLDPAYAELNSTAWLEGPSGNR
ncbi:MAG TPA: carboxypeptidase-like regulatory domain-containing protein, partial [Candidatus Wallbacteria bacterium]|nr:carboxypeptidase-like regulatory domain-containing protein [Candidatus Wallbacteria bacterium]